MKPEKEDLEAATAPPPTPPPTNVAEADKGTVVFAIAGYATCSSLMLVVNKVRNDVPGGGGTVDA